MKLTVYQKPTCTKCRTTLRLLQERGAEFEAINYFETRVGTGVEVIRFSATLCR